MVIELGGKVAQFFRDAGTGAEKMRGAFREFEAPVRSANDALQVSSDRLQAEIDKLEGKRTNTLKLALDEAVVSADDLATALDRDLKGFNKLLFEQNDNTLRKVLGGGTTGVQKMFGGETGFGGFAGSISAITDAGQGQLAAAAKSGDKGASEAAQLKLKTDLLKEYGRQLELVNAALERERNKPGVTIPTGAGYGTTTLEPQINKAAIEDLMTGARLIREQMRHVQLDATIQTQKSTKAKLEGDADASKGGRPYEEAIKSIDAQLDALREKLASVGASEAQQAIAKGFGAAREEVVKINKELERMNQKPLGYWQEEAIYAKKNTAESLAAQTAWGNKLDETVKKIKDEISAQESLTAAIGKGYDAVKSASVEAKVMSVVGPEAYNDPGKQEAIKPVRALAGKAYDAVTVTKGAEGMKLLQAQIALETSLARAQSQGAAAIQLQTLAYDLLQIQRGGGAAAEAEIQATFDMFQAKRAAAASKEIADIDLRIAAVKRLGAAQSDGAEAVRLAGLENKYTEMAQKGATPEVIGKQRQLDSAEYSGQQTAKVEDLVQVYQTHLGQIQQEQDALKQIVVTDENRLDIARVAKNLEDDKLKILVQQDLAQRGAADGVRAFFTEMQESAKSAAEIVYESLHSALEKSSSELANLVEGRKTNFGKMFGDVGHGMLQSTIKSAEQKGLGELAKHSKPLADALGLGKMDGSSPMKALWVRLVAGPSIPGMAAPGSGASADDSLPGVPTGAGSALSTGAQAAGGVLGFFKSLLGIGSKAAGSVPSVSSSISFGGAMADGGPVDPGVAYRVNENEQEYFIPSSKGSIVPHPGAMGGMTVNNYHTIDARGADLGAANRMQRAIEASHKQSVSTAVQAMHERQRRVPAK